MIRNPFRQAAIRSIPSFHHEHPYYRWWVLGNVMVSTFMSVLMSTIVNGALPSMMNAFGATLDAVQWVLTAYLLVFAMMLPFSAWLADRFGYKLVYLGALATFTLGSLCCFLSWDLPSLLFSRILQGVGGGLIMPLGMTLVTREFPPQQRGLAMGFWAIASASSLSLGPSIGGYLIDNFGWRSTFFINVPLGLFAIFATLVIQREYKHGHKPFDLPGFALISLFLVTLLLALSDGNAAWNTGGWNAPFIVTCLLLAGLSLTGFVLVELRTDVPLVDLRLLKNFNFAISNSVMFLLFVSLMGSTFLLPLFFQGPMGYSAFQSGLVFLPLGIMQAVLSPMSGVLGARTSWKIPIVLGISVLVVSLYLNTLLNDNPAPWLIVVPIVLRGVAYGLIFTPLQVMAVNSLPHDRLAQGSGLINLIRQVGGSFGVAIFGLILAQRNIYHSSSLGEDMDVNNPVFQGVVSQLKFGIADNTGQGVAAATTQAKILITQATSKTAYIEAIDDVFFVVALMTLACLIPVFWMKEKEKP